MKDKMTRGQFLGASLGLSLSSTLGLHGFPLGKDNIGYRGDDPNSFEMTEEMKRNYQVALHILKPTQKDLEHGLELHRNSLVFDTYGFMPRAAVDGAEIARAINDSASALELQDMREDMSMSRMAENEREKKEFINAWNTSGVTCMFQNAAYSCNAIEKLIKRLSRFTYTTDKMKDFIEKASSPEEIIQAKNENKKALYLTGNGVPLPQEWITVEEELRYIRIFYQLGIRMLHLTYNRRNVIGDGCGEPTDAGLSDFGRTVVKEMNRVGIIVDIAHSGWQTSLDAARFSEKPMVASHSSVASIHKVVRSKTDEIIKAIADTEGYIGICCIPRFLGGSGDIAAFLKHIDYVAKKFGPDYVSIGTDVAYTSQFDKMENEKVKSMSSRAAPVTRTRFAALWPEETPFPTRPEMSQSMAWTNWPLFTVGLVQMGYSDTDIQKIIGGNAIRVAQASYV
ncbi:MAG: membrane dipeptidase [Cyclobacteriaceae bacterium]